MCASTPMSQSGYPTKKTVCITPALLQYLLNKIEKLKHKQTHENSQKKNTQQVDLSSLSPHYNAESFVLWACITLLHHLVQCSDH
jgi:hypothetical protein